MNKLKPIEIPVKEDNGQYFSYEVDETHIVYQTLYVCPNFDGYVVGGQAIFQHTIIPYHRYDKCPNCDVLIDWEAVDANEAKSKRTFDEWFNKNAVDNSLITLNARGTGYLQTGGAE